MVFFLDMCKTDRLSWEEIKDTRKTKDQGICDPVDFSLKKGKTNDDKKLNNISY